MLLIGPNLPAVAFTELERGHPKILELERNLAQHGWFIEHIEASSVRLTRGAERGCELRMTRCGQRDIWMVERTFVVERQHKYGSKHDFGVTWRMEPWHTDFMRDETGSRSMCLESALMSLSRYVADNPRQLAAPEAVKEITHAP